MSLAQKLLLYALAVALVPLAATGFTVISVGEQALRERIADHQQTAAVAVAAKVSQAVEDVAQRLATVMEVVDLRSLRPRERRGLLRLLYRQSDDISVTLAVDENGEVLGKPVYLSSPATDAPELGRHPASNEADIPLLMDRLPKRAPRPTMLMSGVYFPDGRAPRVAVFVPCCLDEGGIPTAGAGVEIALRSDILKLDGVDTGPSSRVFVVDQRGRVVAHPTVEVGTDLSKHRAVRRLLKEGTRGTSRYALAEEGGGAAAAWAGAYSPVGNLGWGVVVEQPESVAFVAAANMRRQTLLWIGATAVVVLLTGLLFVGRLRSVLKRMVAGARAFGKGKLEAKIEISSKDEIAELAGTMNTMAGDLQQSLAELEEWSRSLEDKVQERTKALKEAQAQLLMQSKLAAIGQLGAGVAHEVNNPLAGILGYAQLLLRKHPEGDPDHKSLKLIEDSARRCKEITINLLRFSEKGLSGRREVPINEVVSEVLGIVSGRLNTTRITLETHLAESNPLITADPGQLALVFINMINNSQNAMPDGGKLTVSTRVAEIESEDGNKPGVCVTITDEGHGIEKEHLERLFEPFFTTKKVWTGAGLGLSVAYRIVNDHGGRIDVQSEVDNGATFEVYLPEVPPEVSEETELPAGPRPSLLK